MQEADLHVPSSEGPLPVVTLIHGGYWATGLDRNVMAVLVEEIGSLGYAVWNIDYRRVGEQGGGWPGTLEDVASAIDALEGLAGEHGLDLDNHAVLGHSAGGQLAFWSAGRPDPQVSPTALVSLSGVLDMTAAAELPDLGRAGRLASAVEDFLGGPPDQHPQRYRSASPIELLPLDVPQLVVHGLTDDRVPLSQSEDFSEAAAALGDEIELAIVRNADHFDVMDTRADWWTVVSNWLSQILGEPPSRAGR